MMRDLRGLKPIFAAVFLAGAVRGYSQGQVYWGDYFNPDFQITIWSPQEFGPYYLTGNSPGNFGTGLTPTGPDIPAGTQTGYTGVPLGGSSTGVISFTDFANGDLWSVQLYAGPLGAALRAVPGAVATMYTVAANQGLYNVGANGTATIPGVPAGSPAQLQLKAWYNSGGAVTSYEAAVFADASTGESTIGIETLGEGSQAPDLPGPGNPGVTGGITSFSLVALVGEIHIGTQPTNQEVLLGASATFSVTVFGDFPASGYQWLFNNLYISGATNSSYTVTNAQPSNAGNYSVIATSENVSVTSQAATLIVASILIDTEPANEEVSRGGSANFSVEARGAAPLAYQWLFKNGNIAGATNSSYSVTNAQPTNAGDYSVVLTNEYGSVTSQVATLTVPTILIVSEPTSQLVYLGSSATFSVEASMGPPLAYQWLFKSADISKETNSNYTVTDAQAANAGNYSVVLTDEYGSVTSAVATLKVILPSDIDVAFTSSSVTSKTGIAATGVTANDFWNTYDVVNTSDLSNLKFVNGTNSGAGLTEVGVYSVSGNGSSDPIPIP